VSALILKFPTGASAAAEPVPSDKVLAGTPHTRLWVHYENPEQKLSAGEWEASVGKWRIAYTEWEYVYVISGSCVITGDDGSTITASAGDGFTIEPGFTGTWEVTAPMRKSWVVKE
jgi:uncharacterized cupin superfamily protein